MQFESNNMASEQFDDMMVKKLLALYDCYDDILLALSGLAMGSGLPLRETKKRYEKAMAMMDDAIQKAGDEIVKGI